MMDQRASGLDPVGGMPWGTHFCEFYRNKQDLIDTLVPYFARGLRDNELCIWVTSDMLERDEAEQLLADAVPDYRERVNAGQIELYDHGDWYVRAGSRLSGVLDQWLHKERDALERGFDGLRLTGDTAFIHRSGWDGFMEYERTVNEKFIGFKLIGLCTYNLDRCTAGDVLDVIRHHQFALARWRGEWELLEQASVKVAKGELERRVEERTHALQAALRGRDEFLAMLGHELRNPLAPIRNAAELIRALGKEHSEVARIGEILERQSGHMARLLDDLLDVARITHGRISLDLQPVDLTTIIAQAVDARRQSLDTLGQRLMVSSRNRTLPMSGDATRLAQVFGNLLDNAIKYTPREGEIRIDMRRERAEAVVAITDTGVGIERQDLTTIFDLFSQGPRSPDRSEGGLGLGLAVVRRLVEMHGGRVEAHSAGRGQGSTFTVRLPLSRAKSDASSRDDDAGAGAREAICVLLIDDNEDAAESLAMLLTARGHEVHVGGDGIAALSMAQRRCPDAVVLDIGLPGMDGYELARRLRRLPGGEALRLVAVTGYGQAEDRARAWEAGFDAFLVKPVNADQLEKALLGLPEQ